MSAPLLEEINAAMQAVNEAEQSVATAQDGLASAQHALVSRSKNVGLLLLEAKKLHPKVKDFKTFLGKVEGLKLSRAYDFMRFAGGRTTDEELKKDARERQAKSRAKKKKLPSYGSGDVIDLEADNFRDVTESAEASAERRKAENAAASTVEDLGNEEALACFKQACDMWLPQLGAADLAAARSHCDYVIRRCAADRRRAA
jgi:hypothetical protein